MASTSTVNCTLTRKYLRSCIGSEIKILESNTIKHVKEYYYFLCENCTNGAGQKQGILDLMRN
jgi:hypothetical protein